MYGPIGIRKRLTATYPGLSCLYHVVVAITRFSPLSYYHWERVTVSSMMISFKGNNIGIIDHLAQYFQIKHTGKVVCLVSVTVELPFDDVSFPFFLCKTLRFRITKAIDTIITWKNGVWANEFFRYLAEDRNQEWFVQNAYFVHDRETSDSLEDPFIRFFTTRHGLSPF